MKKKLFLAFSLFASLGFLLLVFTSNDSSVFKASLLEGDTQEKSISVSDWKKAIEESNTSFFLSYIVEDKQKEFFEFLNKSELKMDIEVKKLGDDFEKNVKSTDNSVFFSFFGVKNNRLDAGNYVYVTADTVLFNPKGSFSSDEFNTALFKNTSSFPFFLDGEFLAISQNGEEVEVTIVSLSESEKDYVFPDELFTVDQKNPAFDLSEIMFLESIKYGFTLTLTR